MYVPYQLTHQLLVLLNILEQGHQSSKQQTFQH